jgi:hypothetical protein
MSKRLYRIIELAATRSSTTVLMCQSCEMGNRPEVLNLREFVGRGGSC